jgi:hypothetical protein
VLVQAKGQLQGGAQGVIPKHKNIDSKRCVKDSWPRKKKSKSGIIGLTISGLVISFCNKIRFNKDIGFLCLYSGRMYDNLILGIHTMSIWFWP